MNGVHLCLEMDFVTINPRLTKGWLPPLNFLNTFNSFGVSFFAQFPHTFLKFSNY